MENSIDREKIIKGITHCKAQYGCYNCQSIDGEDCPYVDEPDCRFSIMQDAFNLLKEQEPRVMKLEDVKAFGWDYCYLEEERLPGKEYRTVCGDYALTCITWPCVASMRIQHGDNNYGKKWRCWTAKPTDKQRQAVKWNE